jgi:hypothetical protein
MLSCACGEVTPRPERREAPGRGIWPSDTSNHKVSLVGRAWHAPN